MLSAFIPMAHILSFAFFILAIRGLSSPHTAQHGNFLGILGMLLAVVSVLLLSPITELGQVLISIILGAGVGIYPALKVKMTSLPQMIAAFNGLGGLSAMFIALAEIFSGSASHFDTSIGLIIGALAFSGSMIAFAKLQGIITSAAINFSFQQTINFLLALAIIILCGLFVLTPNINIFISLGIISIILGTLLVLPIGGADMPIVISILNAYSGLAAAGIGFSLGNVLLIITGTIVGASGTILSYIMVKAMNRTLKNVLFGGYSIQKHNSSSLPMNTQSAHVGSPQDAAYIMENANKVIIVPGYGMAVSQAQHILQKMAYDLHSKYDVEVKFAIHPVAGRMPGHMNVLLAEANVPFEDIYALEDINHEFSSADVAYVIGANDITNPLAKTDTSSPIYGMPILEVEKAKTVFFVKRSLNSGYSGVENPLFFANNTIMLYGDAKKITEEIVTTLENK